VGTDSVQASMQYVGVNSQPNRERRCAKATTTSHVIRRTPPTDAVLVSTFQLTGF